MEIGKMGNQTKCRKSIERMACPTSRRRKYGALFINF
jgi:hypothetical protein